MNIMRLILLAVWLMCAGAPAFACLGPEAESQTFLKSLPEQAATKSIVAEVEILASHDDAHLLKRVSKAKVIDPIKGVEAGQILTILSDIHSCARDYAIGESDIYFIAGEFDEANNFHGAWTGLHYDPYWPLPLK